MTEESIQGKAAARILLVDNDRILLDSLGGFLAGEGYEVTTVTNAAEAMDRLQAGRYQLVLADVGMPDEAGFRLVREIRQQHPDVMVIMITGYGTIESAVEAIKQGAHEYLTKPIIDDDVRLAVERALQQQELLAENRQLRQALAGRGGDAHVIGADFRMAKVLDLVDAVADSTVTVLVTGESGTGKSLIARAIHANSPRRNGPFVEVACGALPETLLEGELFGHVRGAFTGAVADRPGKFDVADGGTIFLDEIATASPGLQVKLLRVLQEREFEPVGSTETQQVDVRVVLATNHDLAAAVASGRFREDLYYRINVVNIELPPLRERVGDICLLAEHFLREQLHGTGKRIVGFAPETMEQMQRYGWPGNVRELENCVERAVVLSSSGTIGPGSLPPAVLDAGVAAESEAPASAEGMTLAEALAGPEKRIIQAALRDNQGSRNRTAEQLGINRTTLFKKMRKYGLLEAPRA